VTDKAAAIRRGKHFAGGRIEVIRAQAIPPVSIRRCGSTRDRRILPHLAAARHDNAVDLAIPAKALSGRSDQGRMVS
jgi:hypothetical protein